MPSESTSREQKAALAFLEAALERMNSYCDRMTTTAATDPKILADAIAQVITALDQLAKVDAGSGRAIGARKTKFITAADGILMQALHTYQHYPTRIEGWQKTWPQLRNELDMLAAFIETLYPEQGSSGQGTSDLRELPRHRALHVRVGDHSEPAEGA